MEERVKIIWRIGRHFDPISHKLITDSMLTLRLLFTSIYLPVNSEDPDETAPTAIFTS